MGGKASRADRHVDVPVSDRSRSTRAGRRPVNHTASRSGGSKRAPARPTRQPATTHSSQPWSPSTPSPLSTDFTISTDNNSVSAASTSHSHYKMQQQHARSQQHAAASIPASRRHQEQQQSYFFDSNQGGYQPQYQRPQEKDRRMIEAEKILEEIAKEYAAKRAAGLVPTKPIPARTLLWEEMAKNRTQAGRRGQCVFGRDTGQICGCTSYKKLRIPGKENPGGVCECCNHGAPWHRLVGGTMARSSRMSRSIIASSVRGSRLETGSSYVPSEARSSLYDYDSDEDDDDEDDEDIANELAVPSHVPYDPPTPPMHYQPPQFGLQSDRLSLLSAGSSFGGFPSRLSSGANGLGALLQAIQRYREMGLDEDEIESRIRDDFPPVARKSSVAARSDLSQSSQVDI